MDLECPTCGSENTQKLSLAVHAGTFKSETFTVGVGGAGKSVGLFGANSSGTSTSKLAQDHAAPEKVGAIRTFLLIMLLSCIAAIFFGGTAITIGFWLAIALAILALLHDLKTYPPEFAEWNAKFICQRCASVFTPQQQSPQPGTENLEAANGAARSSNSAATPE